MTIPLVSPQNDMMCHYPNLGSASEGLKICFIKSEANKDLGSAGCSLRILVAGGRCEVPHLSKKYR